jgi:hypothetical protein
MTGRRDRRRKPQSARTEAWTRAVEGAKRHNYRAHPAPVCDGCVDDAGALMLGVTYVTRFGDDGLASSKEIHIRCPQCRTLLTVGDRPVEAAGVQEPGEA